MAMLHNERLCYGEIELPHREAVQIRFSDYDTFGHINNNAYMAYLDLGKSEMLCELMGRRCTPDEFSAAVVNVNVDFLMPTVVGEGLEVQTGVIRIGEKSFTIYQRVVNPLTGAVKVQAHSVLAGFDIKTQSGAPLRHDLIDMLRGICVEVD